MHDSEKNKMKTTHYIIIGVAIVFAITFFVLGPSQGHIAQYFLTDEQFEDIILSNDNTDRYSTYDESFTTESAPKSQESWDYLLSLPREQARDELQKRYDVNQNFFMDVTINGIQDVYTIGDPLQFTVVEAGYGIPCTAPHVIISQQGHAKPHWEYKFIHSCPHFRDGSPILHYMQVPHNNRIAPPITEHGEYIIQANSLYGSSISKKFTMLDSDYVYDYTLRYTKRGNSTGNTTLEINLNDGNFAIEKNAKILRNVLSSNELTHFKQLIDDGDLLRGHSNIHYESDPTCRACISYTLVISLGNYTHSAIWQSSSTDLWQNHIPIMTMVEKLVNEQT